QLRLLTAHRPRADAPDPVAKATGPLEHLAPARHIAADQAAAGLRRFGHPLIGAAHNPIELLREPLRAARYPLRLDRPADAKRLRALVTVPQTFKPVGRRDRVLVHEGEDRAPRGGDAAVPRAG